MYGKIYYFWNVFHKRWVVILGYINKCYKIINFLRVVSFFVPGRWMFCEQWAYLWNYSWTRGELLHATVFEACVRAGSRRNRVTTTFLFFIKKKNSQFHSNLIISNDKWLFLSQAWKYKKEILVRNEEYFCSPPFFGVVQRMIQEYDCRYERLRMEDIVGARILILINIK